MRDTDIYDDDIPPLAGIDEYDLQTLKMLNSPAEILVICADVNLFPGFQVDLIIPAGTSIDNAMPQINELLREEEVIREYYI